jgi:hypothetical protein
MYEWVWGASWYFSTTMLLGCGSHTVLIRKCLQWLSIRGIVFLRISLATLGRVYEPISQ